VKCPQCDSVINDDYTFCPKCGERLQGLGAESFAELREGSEQGGPAVAPAAGQRPPEPSAGAPAAASPSGLPQGAVSWSSEGTPGDTATLWIGQYSLKGMVDWLFLTGLASLAILVAAFWWQFGSTGWLCVLAVLVLLWGYLGLAYVVRRFGHRYRLTPQTIVHEHGLLLKSTSPIEIICIDDIVMKQSVLERLMGVGTIRILSNDTTDRMLVMRGIPDVRKAFEIIDQTRRAERRRRAVRVDHV